MASIRPLSESVRSSVRSGIFLSDLTRVVEELVFNSLDAGARKVSVFVSVGSCYVKVVDDGAGITRDGLALVGERYATSKFLNLADLDATSGSFGFRGEALASISEVSLLEIVARTYGIPNGYRKVLKGCKCLYLGIDDERKEVGTTVVVRDLFYNQPVRRKYLQSSLKKVLQSVKKCVLRLALVRPNILYKVVDIESEDELLCTHSSSSPLSLLSSGFGVEVSSSLRELHVQDDNIKLCGYISGPSNSFSLKALQYVYINSQFVCKGPIHKLLSQLAIRFEHLSSWNADNGFQSKKRTRSQPCPAYILNLICPRSLYDITFEPSKTYVQFKDWARILDFIEKAIKQFWEENLPHGEFSNHATYMIQADKMWKGGDVISSEAGKLINFFGFFGADMSNCRNQNGMDCLDLFSSTSDKVTKDDYQLSDHEDLTTSVGYLHKGTEKFREQVKRDFLCHTNYSSNSLNGSYAKCMFTVNKKHDEQWMHDNNGLSKEDYFLDDKFSGEESFKDNAAFDAPSSSHGNKSIKYGTDELCNDLKIHRNIQTPFLKSCSRQGSVLQEKSLFVNDENEVLRDSFVSKQNLRVDCGSVEDLLAHTCPEVVKKLNMSKDSDILSRAFAEENLLLLDSCSAAQMGGSGSDHQLLDSEWYSVYPELLSLATPWDVDHMSDHNDIEGMSRYHKMDSYVNLLVDEENECNLSYKRSRISSQDHRSSSFVKTGFDFGCPDGPSKLSYEFVDQTDCRDIYPTKWSDISTDESDWLCLELDREKFQRLGKNRGRRGPFRHSTFEKKHARRSFSAPPFCRRKRRFVSSNQPSIFIARTPTGQTYNRVLNHGGAYEFKHPKQSSSALQLSTEEQLLPKIISNVGKRPEIFADTEVNTIREFDNSHNFNIQSSIPFEDSIDYRTKWRNCSPQLPKNDNMLDTQTQSNILDISAGFLHLAGDSLIPESISKNSLEDAKVLNQVDKKFIPIVAGRTLAIIDQHAADERIRLEELRQKVLSGEAKTISYLDAQKELVLPEIGYQLLHNYAEQVKDWGWICNIHTQDSKSFKRNLDILNRQPMVIILIAVPCILGVKLNDVDLMEFLQQLADTDGSSTLPLSVIRVLNMKACRGAIMFGDSLLPSECSLLVEELKHSSLCFQCAHGRPTTAPLVNLEALHSQIAKLGLMSDSSNDEWHGLRRHEVCVERAAQRLCSAEAVC